MVMKKKYSVFVVFWVSFLSCGIVVLTIWIYTQEDANNKRATVSSESRRLTGIEFNLAGFEKNTFQEFSASFGDSDKVLVVYLLESCNKCTREVSILKQFEKNLSLGIPIIVIMGDKEAVIKEYVDDLGIKFPVLLDRSRKFAAKNKLAYYPANFIVRNGRVEKVRLGSPRDAKELSEFVK